MNCKYSEKIDQHQTPFNCGRTTVVEDDEWIAAQLRKDQEENVDISPLLKWKEDGIKRPGWLEITDESPSFKVL